MTVCHCCQLDPVKTRTILSRALDMVIGSVGSQRSQQVNATSDKQEKKIHLALVKALCLQLSQDMAVWELNEELTILHSVKLV